MSEVAELTNEQELRKRARKWLMDNFDLRWKWAGDHTLSNEDRACMELAAFAQAELLRRFSTQGAGPTCPSCQSIEFRSRVLDAVFEHPEELLRIQCMGCKAIFDLQVHNFPAEVAPFFRAPSDPSRPEVDKQSVSLKGRAE